MFRCRKTRTGALRWVAVAVVCAMGAAAADFELKPGKTLRVLHGGAPLLAEDVITSYSPGWEAGALDVRDQDGLAVANTILEDGHVVQYRREVGVRKDRVELTCQARMLPYRNDPKQPSFSYLFRVPWDRLKNTSWKALTGRVHSVKVQEGQLGDARSDGLIVGQARYIAFSGKDCRLVFDLNPKGLLSQMDFGSGGFLGSWSVVKRGEFVEFGCGINAEFYGRSFAGKALVYEGEYAFERDHAAQDGSYFASFPHRRSIAFGAAAAPEGWEARGAENAEGLVWRDPKTLTVTKHPGRALTANAVVGSGGNALALPVVPGVYLVTLHASGTEAGPFDVTLNGVVKARGVTVKPGAVSEMYLSVYCRAPELTIEFATERSWAVSTLILQQMITTYEDFAFDRGPWLVPGLFTPEG